MKNALIALFVTSLFTASAFAATDCASMAEYFVQSHLAMVGMDSGITGPTSEAQRPDAKTHELATVQVVHTESGAFSIECAVRDELGCDCNGDTIAHF